MATIVTVMVTLAIAAGRRLFGARPDRRLGHPAMSEPHPFLVEARRELMRGRITAVELAAYERGLLAARLTRRERGLPAAPGLG